MYKRKVSKTIRSQGNQQKRKWTGPGPNNIKAHKQLDLVYITNYKALSNRLCISNLSLMKEICKGDQIYKRHFDICCRVIDACYEYPQKGPYHIVYLYEAIDHRIPRCPTARVVWKVEDMRIPHIFI